MALLLCAQGLTLARGKKVLCTALQLQLAGPGLFFITGPNGSGKTTLLLALSGLLPPLKGTVLINGLPLYGKGRMPERTRARQLVYLPQQPSCPPDFTAQDVALLGLAPHRPWAVAPTQAEITQVHQILRQVGFAPPPARPMGQLSGGEQQLVWLAQGLLQNGQLWLLDEPTQHLDAARRHRLLVLLNQLATQENKTLLVVTHELDALMQLPQAYYLDMLATEAGFVPCTQERLAQTLKQHLAALV